MVKAILTTAILIVLLILAIPYIMAGAVCMVVIYIADKVDEFLR